MAYALYNQYYGSAYANSPVKIFNKATGALAIVMSSATGGLLSTHGNAVLDANGNLSVYLDDSVTWVVDIPLTSGLIGKNSVTITCPIGVTYYDTSKLPLPITVVLVPGSGGTLAVDATVTPSGYSNPGAANWIASGSGNVSSVTSLKIDSNCLALRFTAATTAGSAEIC